MSNSKTLDLFRTVQDIIHDAVLEDVIELEDILPELSLVQAWADGFVTAKLNRVPD